jgi:hypothetical protein
MMAGTVFTQLVDTLKGVPSLEYIKNVFKGRRRNIEPDSFPCIMVDVTGNGEIEQNYADQIKKVWLDVELRAFIQINDPEYAIVGDDTRGHVGVLDIENDIRAVLADSYQLGCRSEDLRVDKATFNDMTIENIMYREIVMPLRILYKQTNGV